MARLKLTSFLILLVLLVPAVTAANAARARGRANMRRRGPLTFQQMVRYIQRKMQPTSDKEEWGWTVRPRNAGDLNKPMPTNTRVLKHMCWSYFGHPQTIRDVNSFFKWGCQPYPVTCAGIRKLPKQCIERMFYTRKNIRPAQVRQLYRRCRLEVRPLDKRTGKYVSYCQDMIKVVQAKITLLAKKQGQY